MNANNPNLDIDQTIDRALSALRDAQPRFGLEARILTSLEHRATTPRPMRLHPSVQIALWAATSAAVLAIGSLVILHHPVTGHTAQTVVLSEAPHSSERSKDPAAAHRATNSEPFSATKLVRNTSTVSSRAERATRSGKTTVFRNAGKPKAADDDLDATALGDLRAPSHPAPPLPLTPQEKLFLRMLRDGNATQLAELNPSVRAAHDAAEAADFKTFFPDPPPVKQPGDTE